MRFVGTKKILLRHILTFSAHHISGCCSDITIHVRNSSLGVKRAHMVRNREGYLDIISGLFQTNRHYTVVTFVPRTANLRNASLYQTRDGEWMVTEIINSPINRCAIFYFECFNSKLNVRYYNNLWARYLTSISKNNVILWY